MSLELAKAYIRVRADGSQLRPDLQSAGKDFTSTAQAMGQEAGKSIAKGIQAGLVGVLAPAALFTKGFLRKGLAQAAEFEQTTIAFETMLGSAKETSALLADLTDFAALTPFEMPELLQATRGLVQFGERGDELMETLQMLGNAASGTSTPFGMIALIFNQVRGVGKLLTQDFRQLSTRGVISLQDIAKHYKVTTAEAQNMLSSGKISFEGLKEIFRGMSEEGGRFYKLMEKQSQSLSGLQSTLSDAWNIMARQLATALVPAVKLLTSAAIKAVEALSGFVDVSGPAASGAVAGAAAFSALGAAIFGAGLAAKFFGISLKGALIGTGIGIAVVALGSAVGALVAWFTQTDSGMESLSNASGTLRRAWENLKSAADTIFEAIGDLIFNVFGVTWANSINSASDWMAFLVDSAASALLKISEWAKFTADAIGFLFRNASELVQIAFIDMALGIIEFSSSAQSAYESVAAIAAGTFDGIWAFFSSWLESIKGGFIELKNLAEAVWAAVAAGLVAAFEGKNPLDAMKDAFIDTLAAQEDAKGGGNPFEAFLNAYNKTKEEIEQGFEAGGGAAELLRERKKQLEDEIKKREQDRGEPGIPDDVDKPDKDKPDMLKDAGGGGGGTDAGRFRVEEFGNVFQDAVLKGEDQQVKMVGLLEQGNKIQEQQLEESKKNKPTTLTGDGADT